MEMYLMKEKLWQIVTGEPVARPPTNTTTDQAVLARRETQQSQYDEWLIKDNEARAIIGLHVDEDQYCHLRGKSTAKACWTTLKEHHEKDSLGNKVSLMRRICAKKLPEGESVEKHMTEFNELFQRLSDLGENGLADNWRVAIILSSLPKSYDSMISALEVRREDELTLSLVQSKLLDECKRRIEDGGETSDDKALKTTESKTCHFCKKLGHFKSECRKFKRFQERKSNPDKNDKTNSNKGEKANVTAESKNATSNEVLFSLSSLSKNAWIIDSGRQAT